MSQPVLVACTVAQGLFEGEFYVTVEDSSAYTDRTNVRVTEAPDNGTEVRGKVLAYLVEEKNDRALIELVGEPVVGGLRTWVSRSAWAYAQ